MYAALPIIRHLHKPRQRHIFGLSAILEKEEEAAIRHVIKSFGNVE